MLKVESFLPKEDLLEQKNNKLFTFWNTSFRDHLNRQDVFVLPLRAVRVDGFSVSLARNRLCLSLSKHQSAAAGQQHRSAWVRVQEPAQVNTNKLKKEEYDCYSFAEMRELCCCLVFILPSNVILRFFRNWCQYTVSRTVLCKVHNGTETSVQRVLGCRWPGPCAKVIRYLHTSSSPELFSYISCLSFWAYSQSWEVLHRPVAHLLIKVFR